MCNKPEITSPIVGVSNVKQLKELIESASIKLEKEDVVYLEELYEPLENLLSIGMS
jgi:aryl-alcohol dehydrogenase-like predicted oxidoreductase